MNCSIMSLGVFACLLVSVAQVVSAQEPTLTNKKDIQQFVRMYSAGMQHSHEPDKILSSNSPTVKENHHLSFGEGACESVTIINVKRQVAFDDCNQICHTHKGHFYATGSHAEGACLESVPGADIPFWVKTVQKLPVWGESHGSYLLNTGTGLKVSNFAPIVHRNMPNGVQIMQGLERGKATNCLYHFKGQLFGTRCDPSGLRPEACACSVKHARSELPCSAIQVVHTPTYVHSWECPDVCGPMRYFAPSNKRELHCLNNNFLTAHPTWVNMIQYLPVPGSKAFPLLANIMTNKMLKSFQNAVHQESPFTANADESHTKGVAQNCIYFQAFMQGEMSGLYTTRCHTGQLTRQCACVPWPRELNGQ